MNDDLVVDFSEQLVPEVAPDAPDVALAKALDGKGPQELVARECGKCTWCPAGAQMCNWRYGMYPGDKEPRRSKVVLHALDPEKFGIPMVVAQPYKDRLAIPQHTLRWLTLMSIKVPVAVLDAPARDGGKIRLILTPDEKVREFVALVLQSLMPPPGHVPPAPVQLLGLDGNLIGEAADG